MKAPCCLLGAAALPRPPERASGISRSARAPTVCRVSYTCMLCVCWVVLVVVTRASAYTACPVRTDARDVASKAYVSPQVVEAVVREVGLGAPGRPYTVTVVVSKKLRSYSGRARVKKRDILTLTFRYPLANIDRGVSAEESDNDGDCLVSAILQPRHKYLLFLSGPSERSAQPVPMAPPEPATKKLRRLVRKTVCKNCGQPPKVRGLQDDSVVASYNLTLECTAEGVPTPQLLWFKDGQPLTASRNVKIRTRAKRLKRRRLSPGRTARSPRLAEGRARAREGRRSLLTTLGRRLAPRPTGIHDGRKRRAGRGARGGGTRGGRRSGGRMGGNGRGRGGGGGGRRVNGGGKSEVGEAGGKEMKRRRGRRLGRRQRTGKDAKRKSSMSEDDTLGPARRRHDDSNRLRPGSSDSAITSDETTNVQPRRQRRRPPSSYKRVQVSQLTVRAATMRDAGQYRCVARSVAGEADIEASIRVVQPIDPHTAVDKCPYDGYCLNGGTCMMFTVVGELVCQCAEGYKGQRCQEKEVYPTFNRNCHGPIRNLRHSQGRRCPRNQPTALWELLQQTLALKRRNKVTPWTKTQLLTWPPTHTSNAFWSRYTRPALSLSPPPNVSPRQGPNPATAQPGPAPLTPPPPPPPSHASTEFPIFPSDPPLRGRHWRPHQRPLTSAPPPSPLPTHPLMQPPQSTIPKMSPEPRAKPVTAEDQHLSPQAPSDGETTLATHQRHRHHHHHRRRASRSRSPPSTQEEAGPRPPQELAPPPRDHTPPEATETRKPNTPSTPHPHASRHHQ